MPKFQMYLVQDDGNEGIVEGLMTLDEFVDYIAEYEVHFRSCTITLVETDEDEEFYVDGSVLGWDED